MATLDTLRTDLATLRQMRAEYDAIGAELVTAFAALDATPEGQALAQLKAQSKQAASLMADMENTIKAEAVEYFVQTGERKPAPGVAIKIFRLAQYDRAVAEPWIRTSAPALLVPDWKGFEKTAEALGGPIEWIDDARAQIASALE